MISTRSSVRTTLHSLLFGALLSSSSIVLADASLFQANMTAEEKGLAIATEQDKRDEGWKDSQSNMTMILKDRKGRETVRQMRSKSLEITGDGDKSLTIFDHPKDVEGTSFLTHSHVNAQDDQWLYLPALKRVKRINSRNKSGSFMGSEFSYEDLSSPEVSKYTYKYLKDETVNGVDCYIVESYPVDKDSGYSKLVSWIDKKDLRGMKTEFYDRKNKLLKTLMPQDYKLHLDKHWRAAKMSMENHQNGKSTVIEMKDFTFKKGLGDNDFDKNSLKRSK